MPGRRVRRRLATAVLLAAATAAAGCTASSSSPPTGVDTLTIPTPEPDADDFVAEVDNRWLPLPVGATWTYRVREETAGYRLRVTVEPGPEVAGVETTAVRREPQVGKRQLVSLTPSTDWYAQDRDGNVWWFGRADGWRAGEAGAQAGLVMPGEPRFGDGFRMALAPGIDQRAEVAEVDPDLGRVQLDVHRGEVVRTERYAVRVGLQSWSTAGLGTSGTLLSHDLDE